MTERHDRRGYNRASVIIRRQASSRRSWCVVVVFRRNRAVRSRPKSSGAATSRAAWSWSWKTPRQDVLKSLLLSGTPSGGCRSSHSSRSNSFRLTRETRNDPLNLTSQVSQVFRRAERIYLYLYLCRQTFHAQYRIVTVWHCV